MSMWSWLQVDLTQLRNLLDSNSAREQTKLR